MEIAGPCYLKYADTTHQGFNRYPKAKYEATRQIEGNFKEQQPASPYCC